MRGLMLARVNEGTPWPDGQGRRRRAGRSRLAVDCRASSLTCSGVKSSYLAEEGYPTAVRSMSER